MLTTLEKMLTKPIVFFDLETTGTDTEKDRIVQLAAVRISPDNPRSTMSTPINPGMHIPAEASEVHGITDADVADAPTFKELLEVVNQFFSDHDIAGFNITGFDIPLLRAEYFRCGREFELRGRRIVDAMEIFHRKMPRNLETAVQFYCGRELTEAHDALADVHGSIDVLNAQLKRYEDLPGTVHGLSDWCRGDKVTLDGKVAWDKNGEACLTFGKHKGRPLRKVFETDRGYLSWMVDQRFPEETLDVIGNALRGEFPEKAA